MVTVADLLAGFAALSHEQQREFLDGLHDAIGSTPLARMRRLGRPIDLDESAYACAHCNGSGIEPLTRLCWWCATPARMLPDVAHPAGPLCLACQERRDLFLAILAGEVAALGGPGAVIE
jgi:hypothetical protein